MIHLKVCTLKKCLVPPKSNPWGYMYPQINLLVGMLGQGGCEWRSEAFVKIQKKKIFFLEGLGVGSGGEGGSGWGVSGWMGTEN